MNAESKRGTTLLKAGITLALIGALGVFLAGYGYQWGWWHYRIGFRIIPWATGGVVLAGIITTIGFIGLYRKTAVHTIIGCVGIALSLAAIFNIVYWRIEINKGYPLIHDITTDMENPPMFVDIIELRSDAPNPAEYQGEEVAKAQKEFYSGLGPIQLQLNYDEAFNQALANAEKMPWQIISESKEEGRIEAYEKLAWFGFIDDVVIRVDTTSTGSIIDIRSKSRIGRGDLGVNAKRIKRYKATFKALKD